MLSDWSPANAQLFSALLQEDPESPDAWGGLIRALVALGCQVRDGVTGVWVKMADGKDAAPTPGLKALGTAREHWHGLVKEDCRRRTHTASGCYAIRAMRCWYLRRAIRFLSFSPTFKT